MQMAGLSDKESPNGVRGDLKSRKPTLGTVDQERTSGALSPQCGRFPAK